MLFYNDEPHLPSELQADLQLKNKEKGIDEGGDALQGLGEEVSFDTDKIFEELTSQNRDCGDK